MSAFDRACSTARPLSFKVPTAKTGPMGNTDEPLDLTTSCSLKKNVYDYQTKARVIDTIGEIDLRYVVSIQLEDASGHPYQVSFTTKPLSRLKENSAQEEEIDPNFPSSRRIKRPDYGLPIDTTQID